MTRAEGRRGAARPVRVRAVAPVEKPLDGPAWLAALAIAVGLAALGWASRGFTLGAPVADDYAFLFHQRFQHPLDPFDSMGATYYWRPLSRQLVFVLLGPALPDAPWAAALLNGALLVLTAWLLLRTARRWLTPPLAAALAVIPLLSEPARALLTWPSGVQHLLAGAFAALAVHEAAAGRRLLAVLAGFAGVLSHESAVFVLLMLPGIAAWREQSVDRATRIRAAVGSGLVVAGALALWAAGYAIAIRHGVVLPPRPHGLLDPSRLAGLAGHALRGGFDLEDQTMILAGPAIAALVVLAVAAGIALTRAPARRRLKAFAPAIAMGLGVFLLGALPLAWLLPDWNAWRAWIPTMGLMVALTLLCAAAVPWLAIGLAGLRLAMLLVAPSGPATVSPAIPETESQMSFIRLVRLQRIVESARRSMRAHVPTLGRGAAVRYWELPRFAEVAFLDRTALEVWYGDTTLVWSRFGGLASLHQPVDAMLEFTESQPMPGYVLEPEAVRLYLAGWRAQHDNRWEAADSLFVLARQATRTRWALVYAIANNRARVAVARGRPDQAVGFLEEYASIKGRDASYWAVSAWIEARYGSTEAALEQVQRCLALDPANEDGLRLAQALRQRPRP